MKARTPPSTYKQIKAEVTKEVQAHRAEIFMEAAGEVEVQNLAVVFWTMSKHFGWGKKRLRQLADALHETEELMNEPSKLHHRFNATDCEKSIKEEFGIDLRGEFKVEVEIKP